MDSAIRLKAISLVTLTIQNSALTVLLHLSRTRGPPFASSSAVLLVELTKCTISLAVAARNSFATSLPSNSLRPPHSPAHPNGHGSPMPSPFAKSPSLAEPALARAGFFNSPAIAPVVRQPALIFSRKTWRGWVRRLRWEWEDGRYNDRIRRLTKEIFSRDCWKLSIPAILYVIQNNLQFVAASNLDVATFQVSYQLKILTTALCSVLMLKRRLSTAKWVSLFFLALGVAIVQLQSTPSDTKTATHVMNPFTGFLAVALACMTSGLAGVYFEMVLKGSKADLWIRNVQLSLFSLPPALSPAIVSMLSSPLPDDPPRQSMFANFSFWAYSVVATQVIGGLVTALVIKYADNILKGFATSLSIVLSFLAGVVIFDAQITPGFVLGTSIVLGATWGYNRSDAPQGARSQPLSNAELAKSKEKDSMEDGIRGVPSDNATSSMLQQRPLSAGVPTESLQQSSPLSTTSQRPRSVIGYNTVLDPKVVSTSAVSSMSASFSPPIRHKNLLPSETPNGVAAENGGFPGMNFASDVRVGIKGDPEFPKRIPESPPSPFDSPYRSMTYFDPPSAKHPREHSTSLSESSLKAKDSPMSSSLHISH